MMTSVKAYYDGKNYITESNVVVKPNQRVIITILDGYNRTYPITSPTP